MEFNLSTGFQACDWPVCSPLAVGSCQFVWKREDHHVRCCVIVLGQTEEGGQVAVHALPARLAVKSVRPKGHSGTESQFSEEG